MASQEEPSSSASSYSLQSVVTGHHIYKSVWSPTIGETLALEREEDNVHDRYAVTVIRNESIVGHMPRSISRVSSYFLMHGGSIECSITGHRRHGHGLEVPCVYVFKGTGRMIRKVTRLLEATENLPPESCPF